VASKLKSGERTGRVGAGGGNQAGWLWVVGEGEGGDGASSGKRKLPQSEDGKLLKAVGVTVDDEGMVSGALVFDHGCCRVRISITSDGGCGRHGARF
jgi:hypothetical protein